MTHPARRHRQLLVAHPAPDVYGSDLQLLESVSAARHAGWRVLVVLPQDGPLVPILRARGAGVRFIAFPVLRKALASPAGIVSLAARSVIALVRLTRLLRKARPDVLYVNTVTIPTWLIAARLAGIPALCHVHEAEEEQSLVVRRAMVTPLLLAGGVLTNSKAARRALTDVVDVLGGRTEVVPNGVPGPTVPPLVRPTPGGPAVRLAVVGRLSPRKGTDVAIEATALLRRGGRDVALHLYGSAFPGYEEYLAGLRHRALEDDLRGHVHFHGYVHPTWPALAAADIVLVPSRFEPFGNVAVEALLAGRPLIASAVQGLLEVVRPGETGLLVPSGDPDALADAVTALIDDPARASCLAEAGRADAQQRFSVARYRARIVDALDRLSPGDGRE